MFFSPKEQRLVHMLRAKGKKPQGTSLPSGSSTSHEHAELNDGPAGLSVFIDEVPEDCILDEDDDHGDFYHPPADKNQVKSADFQRSIFGFSQLKERSVPDCKLLHLLKLLPPRAISKFLKWGSEHKEIERAIAEQDPTQKKHSPMV